MSELCNVLCLLEFLLHASLLIWLFARTCFWNVTHRLKSLTIWLKQWLAAKAMSSVQFFWVVSWRSLSCRQLREFIQVPCNSLEFFWSLWNSIEFLWFSWSFCEFPWNFAACPWVPSSSLEFFLIKYDFEFFLVPFSSCKFIGSSLSFLEFLWVLCVPAVSFNFSWGSLEFPWVPVDFLDFSRVQESTTLMWCPANSLNSCEFPWISRSSPEFCEWLRIPLRYFEYC